HDGARLHQSRWPLDCVLQSTSKRREAIESMRYVMSQKFFSLADSFTIKDENEHDAYLVKGKVFSFGDKLSFQDTEGNELVYIDQRLLNWSPTYELWRGADLLAVVKRQLFSFIHHRFT